MALREAPTTFHRNPPNSFSLYQKQKLQIGNSIFGAKKLILAFHYSNISKLFCSLKRYQRGLQLKAQAGTKSKPHEHSKGPEYRLD